MASLHVWNLNRVGCVHMRHFWYRWAQQWAMSFADSVHAGLMCIKQELQLMWWKSHWIQKNWKTKELFSSCMSRSCLNKKKGASARISLTWLHRKLLSRNEKWLQGKMLKRTLSNSEQAFGFVVVMYFLLELVSVRDGSRVCNGCSHDNFKNQISLYRQHACLFRNELSH